MIKKGEQILAVAIILSLTMTGCIDVPFNESSGTLTYDIDSGEVKMADVLVGYPVSQQEAELWINDCTAEYREAIDMYQRTQAELQQQLDATADTGDPSMSVDINVDSGNTDVIMQQFRKGYCVAEQLQDNSLRISIFNTIPIADFLNEEELQPDGSYEAYLGDLGGMNMLYRGVITTKIQVKTTYELVKQTEGYHEDGGFHVYEEYDETKYPDGKPIKIYLNVPEEELLAKDTLEDPMDEATPVEDNTDDTLTNAGDISDPMPLTGDQDVMDEKDDEYDPVQWFNPDNIPDMTIYLYIAGGVVLAVLLLILTFKIFSNKKDRKMQKLAKQVHEEEEKAKHMHKIKTPIVASNQNPVSNSSAPAQPTQKAGYIIPYIRENLHRGYKPSQIRNALLKSGWKTSIVDEAFERVL